MKGNRKTTTIKLLKTAYELHRTIPSAAGTSYPQVYEPQKGDGHDVTDLKHKFLRENIGLVQQNVFLFDDSIRNNIMYGIPTTTEKRMFRRI